MASVSASLGRSMRGRKLFYNNSLGCAARRYIGARWSGVTDSAFTVHNLIFGLHLRIR